MRVQYDSGCFTNLGQKTCWRMTAFQVLQTAAQSFLSFPVSGLFTLAAMFTVRMTSHDPRPNFIVNGTWLHICNDTLRNIDWGWLMRLPCASSKTPRVPDRDLLFAQKKLWNLPLWCLAMSRNEKPAWPAGLLIRPVNCWAVQMT